MYIEAGACGGVVSPDEDAAHVSSLARQLFASFASPPLTPTMPYVGEDG
jgi:hypothetical protein